MATAADVEQTGGRTPSMGASILVFVVMIGLIFTSIFLFGDHVAAGPLQISITLASLFALGIAYFYGYRTAVISEAIRGSVMEAIGVIFIILAIGAVIGTLYLAGTVAAFVYYGVEFISPRFFYVIVFLLTSLLSILTGSSFTTIGAVGVAFVGLATLMGLSPAVAAGAAASGAFFGDKVARISDTFVLTTAVVGADPDKHSRFVWRTAIPAWIISALLFTLVGLSATLPDTPVDVTAVQDTIAASFNISLLAFIPVVVIFVLSSLRVTGFISLMVASLVAIVLAAFTQNTLIMSLATNSDISYLGAVVEVSFDTMASGFQLNSGIPQMDQLFAGGGTFAMFETLWLILIAAAFGAIVGYTGMIQRVIAPVIEWANNAFRLVLATSLTTMGLNILTADSYVAIMLGSRMFRDSYIDAELKPAVLSGTIADSGSIFSPIIPWNVHGAFIGGALGVSVLSYAPFAFLCYLSPLISLVVVAINLQTNKLPKGVEANEVYHEEPEEFPTPRLTA